MDILVNATNNGVIKGIGWIGLQPGGSISVGLRDKSFVAPTFRARNLIFNAYNRIPATYLIQNTPGALISVTNPHLTFHPPIMFHVRDDNRGDLFEGLADISIMLDQQPRVNWVRAISRPLREVVSKGAAGRPRSARSLSIETATDDCSIGLGVDFVRQNDVTSLKEAVLNEFIDWHGYRIHVHAEVYPSHIATLAWEHEG